MAKYHTLFSFFFSVFSNLLIYFLETHQELRSLIGKTGHKAPLIVVANELGEPVLSNGIMIVTNPSRTQKNVFVHGYSYDHSGSGDIIFNKKMGDIKRFTLAFWIYPTKNSEPVLHSSIKDVGFFFLIYTDEHCYTGYVNI